jgi:hypothetical protein
MPPPQARRDVASIHRAAERSMRATSRGTLLYVCSADGGGGKLSWTKRGCGHAHGRAARRVLQAAAVEAHGRPGAYVTQERVMQRANIVDAEHFISIANYLEERGWIAEPDADYGAFVVTTAGIDGATNVTERCLHPSYSERPQRTHAASRRGVLGECRPSTYFYHRALKPADQTDHCPFRRTIWLI